MKAGELGTQIIVAGATAAVATTIGVLISNWLTKRSTTENIASGKTPLPPGSTPTTTGPPGNITPVSPQPQPQPQPHPADLLSVASSIAQALPKNPCPPGYHAVPGPGPNFPYMCIQD